MVIQTIEVWALETVMSTLSNLLTDIPKNVPDELVQVLLSKPNTRIERIISLGHTTPEGCWYDQGQHEVVVLLQGSARLVFEGDESTVQMMPGSFIDISAHRRHRVECSDPHQTTIWLAVHYDI